MYKCVCLLYWWVNSVARSCAAWDDNNKDNVVCKPNIPAGIKCPPPSKTISPIARFGANSTKDLSQPTMAQQELHRCVDINKDMSGSQRVEGNSSAAIQPAMGSSHSEVGARRQTYPQTRAYTCPVKSLPYAWIPKERLAHRVLCLS